MRWHARLTVLLALSLTAACNVPGGEDRQRVDSIGSRVDLFLRPTARRGFDVVLDLESVALRNDDGELLELELQQATISSAEGVRPVQFAGAPVPPGSYLAIHLRVRRAGLVAAGAQTALTLLPALESAAPPRELTPDEEQEPMEYVVPVRSILRSRDALALFLDWNVGASLVGSSGLRPALAAEQSTPQVVLGRLYVTDAETGSILVLDPASGDILATGKVGNQPKALAASRNRRRVFVANARDGSLSLFDLRENQTTSSIPVRLGAGTQDVAVVDPRVVVAANRSLDTVSFFDVLAEERRFDDVNVGRGPVRLAVSERLRRVFVVNGLSDDVSVIDVNSRSVVGTIAVESQPTDISMDRRERELFVGHETSPNLLVIDASTLAVVDSIYVGRDVTAVLADRRRDRVYVAKGRPSELVVVDRRLKSVLRRVRLSGDVENLAQPLEGSLVYGAAPRLGGVLVINVIRAREEALLPCGSSPTDVVVLD